MMTIGSLSLKRARPGAVRSAEPVAAAISLAENSATVHPSPNASRLRDKQVASQKMNMVRPGKEVTDEMLLERFQNGDEEGYVELYLRRQAQVYTFALRLAGGDRDLASDLFQETFIKVYRKAHTFRVVTSKEGERGTNVLGWLYTIVRTTYLNHKRQRTLVGLDDTAAEIPSTDRSLAPEFREEQATLKARVESAIHRLPAEIREPFVLREFDGLSYEEISKELNITLGAVRQRIYRAKLAMREELWDLVHDDTTIGGAVANASQ
ncbi:MAG TPA: sigma-70 family RNA polymerase sigma factor [Candidatus Kapabacteria bacterium]|jgi:RNA polymerase sigma-70 factor (ECF subfamily)